MDIDSGTSVSKADVVVKSKWELVDYGDDSDERYFILLRLKYRRTY